MSIRSDSITVHVVPTAEQIASLPRIVLIEDKLETFLSKEAYAQSEAIQNQNVKALLEKLKLILKDVDLDLIDTQQNFIILKNKINNGS